MKKTVPQCTTNNDRLIDEVFNLVFNCFIIMTNENSSQYFFIIFNAIVANFKIYDSTTSKHKNGIFFLFLFSLSFL